MLYRIRPLTSLELLAIKLAKELQVTLEKLQATPTGSRSDAECIEDALEGLETRVIPGLEDLGLPEDICHACQKPITPGTILCNNCFLLSLRWLSQDAI